MPTKYAVIDRQTGQLMGVYATRRKATQRADRLDLAYGAIRYRVQPVELRPDQLTAGKDVDLMSAGRQSS
jgi:hypothetical protein